MIIKFTLIIKPFACISIRVVIARGASFNSHGQAVFKKETNITHLTLMGIKVGHGKSLI